MQNLSLYNYLKQKLEDSKDLYKLQMDEFKESRNPEELGDELPTLNAIYAAIMARYPKCQVIPINFDAEVLHADIFTRKLGTLICDLDVKRIDFLGKSSKEDTTTVAIYDYDGIISVHYHEPGIGVIIFGYAIVSFTDCGSKRLVWNGNQLYI